MKRTAEQPGGAYPQPGEQPGGAPPQPQSQPQGPAGDPSQAGHIPAPGYVPPAGYAPQPGYGPPPGFAQPAQPAEGGGVKVGAPTLLSIISIAAIALAVSLEEDGRNGWEDIGVWAGFAIVAAVATLAPSLRSNLSLETSRAWQIGVAGAIGLAAFWVLFILPSIQQNVSFLATVGVVAGGLAVWLAPGRPEPSASGPGQSW